MRDYELTASLYLGILFGFRTYDHHDCVDYALYIPFLNITYTHYK